MPPRVLDDEQIARWRPDLEARMLRWRVAESAGSVIGFAGTGPSRDPVDPGLGELDTIAVAPSAWRRGVGAQLMKSALSALSRAGYEQAILWTLAEYEQARLFYEATGWRRSGEARDSGRQIAFRRVLSTDRAWRATT